MAANCGDLEPSAVDTLDAATQRALASLVTDGIIVTDADLDRGPHIRYVNEAIVRTTGYTRDELLGQSPRIFQGERTSASERRRVANALRAGTPVRAELVNYRSDGVEYLIEIDITPIRNGDTVTGFVAIQRDVTTRRLGDRWFRALVEHSGELITVNDQHGRVVYVSPSVRTVLGWDPAVFIGRMGAEFVHPDDVGRIVRGLQAVTQYPSRTTAPEQFRFLHADGSWRWLEGVTTNLLDNPSVQGVVVNARDITHRKQLELQLQQAAKMEAIGRLAGGVAHDFNNLLAVIAGHAELLAADFDGTHPLAAHLDAITAASERAKGLTRQLLTIGRQDFSRAIRVDANKLVEETALLLDRIIGDNIQLVVNRSPQPAAVFIDPDQLGQVLMNLAVNARDAMPNGGRLEMLVIVTDDNTPTPPSVRVTVSDSGIGMDPDTALRIFEPFFTTKQHSGGTGLGLATAFSIIDQAGGSINVISQPEIGTTFDVMLPMAIDA